MPSIVKIPLNGRVFPGLCALSLVLAVLLGAVPRLGGSEERRVTVVDDSPSSQPPDPLPEGALRFVGSDLGAALARAAAEEPGARIRLLTDGCHTGASFPTLPGVPVDVVLCPRRDNVRLMGLEVPESIEPGVDFAVTVTVGRTAGNPDDPREISVFLTRDGRRLGAERFRLVLRRGERRSVRIRDRVDEPGRVSYRAVVEGGPGAAADDSRQLHARVGHVPEILALGPTPPLESLRVVRDSVLGLDSFDAAILAGELPAAIQAGLAAAVDRGLGLVVVGGAGFGGKPLERILPLTDTPPGGRALLLLLDFSGSMEPRKPDLLQALEALREFCGPKDRLAAIVFRDRVVRETGWAAAQDSKWDFASLQARGNTRLEPALEAAQRALSAVQANERRLIVVSDGEWTDVLANAVESRQAVNSMESSGIQAAALFVGEVPPEAAMALFPRNARATSDLRERLVELEKGAAERFVAGPLEATKGEVPGWLGDASPGAGPYRSVTRLYPRGVGERIALRSERAPLVAALDAGGRVVVVTPDPAANAAVSEALPNLLRAVMRRPAPPWLRAKRAGMGLDLEAHTEDRSPFLVDGREVPARPGGPGLWVANVSRVASAPFEVGYAGETVLVPAEGDRELAGLNNRPDVAGEIARRSGGRLFVGSAPDEPSRGAGRAAWILLLLAVAAVVWSAVLRRKS